MTLDEYKRGLETFDWYYNYSDDYSVWSQAQKDLQVLKAAQAIHDPNREIWTEVVRRKVK